MASWDDKLDRLLGAKSGKALESALELTTVGDLLRHYPRRYAERGELTRIADLAIGEHVSIMAEVRSCVTRQMASRPGTITQAIITDGRAQLSLTFFKQKYHQTKLLPGTRGMFSGKVSQYNKKLQLTHPDYKLIGDEEDGSALQEFASGLIPVYPASKDLQTWTIANCVRQVLDQWDGVADPVPEEMLTEAGLSGLSEALRRIHQPNSWAEVTIAKQRLKWDEALALQLVFAQRRHSAVSRPAPSCPRRGDGVAAAFDEVLPFTLTDGQREIGELISADMATDHPMNLLLQGEVGSGKTLVALRAMLQAVDAGRQAAMLAPTEVLAAQHARSLAEMLGDLARAGELGAPDVATRVTLLTGVMGAKERKQALLDAASGAAGIVIGTHALIQDRVSFADLGLVVVDEQHRFGVEQRDALRTRAAGGGSPHILVMTATPIPRTVAMTVYGDLKVAALRELPKGRSPISTSVVPAAEKPRWLDRTWQRIREEVAKGHQAYVVCPRIGESEGDEDEAPPKKSKGAKEPKEPKEAKEESDRRPPLAVMDVAPRLASGPLRGLRVGVLHGKLPTDEKDAVMRAFGAGELDVLVATTVVEVGVNVPNATVMVIMDADRFGVSQLHQLRGRVGRGSAPGLCLLVSEIPANTTTRQRLEAVAATTDGFELARLDLELRREGDILGSAQSGKRSTLKMLSLLQDEDVIEAARVAADDVVAADPELLSHPGLAGMVSDLIHEEHAEFLEKS
ncbi:ATP-dependent DNA helicase RecG [Allokutzneria sp. A3M-2-11 16]|uniref:ATP-dependent DNA helicase RecG n=1 Tax=Allokutzneria sp. A3M-2-11 16 TaxID=2962043 RepID=UPI0020B77203|nr:ATP-dependent DNA helicase RecG [Allokutzneria sp. A3M-2-11 16]MCP3798047.1 ATP-dependent DNA helicase RecG [Allokutzneria sp. A3M-2-11 16]